MRPELPAQTSRNLRDQRLRAVLDRQEIEAAMAVLESGLLGYPTGGPHMADFESRFAEFHRTNHGIMTCSGTAALELVLSALGVRDGDEVIVPAFTFIAPAAVVQLLGARPVFADVDAETFCIDPLDVRSKLSPRTRAVIAVHSYGVPADMIALRELASSAGIFLIEDCAQAHGATYRGQTVGSLGDAACFSFFQTKNMTCGQGGMVLCNKDGLAQRVRALRNHGRTDAVSPYEYVCVGWNHVPTELQAAIASVQLTKLLKQNELRTQNATAITRGLRTSGIRFQTVPPHSTHAYYKLSGLLKPADATLRHGLINAIRARGAWVSTLYPSALCCVPALAAAGPSHCSRAEEVARRIVNFDVSPRLTQNDLELTITATLASLAEIRDVR